MLRPSLTPQARSVSLTVPPDALPTFNVKFLHVPSHRSFMLDSALMRCYLLLMCLVCIGANASILADNMKETRSVDIPLHDRIDAFVEQEAIGALAPLCSDADFLRRVHLDLSGTIPTANRFGISWMTRRRRSVKP